MRVRPGLGATNFALISLYFAPVWATEALHALRSPYSGFDDRAHAGAAVFVREIFDFTLDGLVRTSHLLAGAKLVIAGAFLAYLIEFSRAVAVGREPDRATLNITLFLAVAGIVVWAVPALALGEGALVRHCATQFLLVAGAVMVILVERLAEENSAVRVDTPVHRERELAPSGPRAWLPIPAPVQPASSAVAS
jgi:hypothetical protein